MKKKSLLIAIMTGLVCAAVSGQESPGYSKIDIMLVRGEYSRVIDTCNQILNTDSLNAEIYYKKGLACQNLLPDDKSLGCFQMAASLNPDNKEYKFMIAKSYYSKGKNIQAKPLFESLCLFDSTNWSYAYYLTSIYMQQDKYDESLKIYERFHKQDSGNYAIIDKIGFAYLQKGDYEIAIEQYNKSLEINPDNINALKNLAFLYSVTTSATKGLKLLTRGIAIDSTDMDLYERRAALNYTIFNFNRALSDYLKLINYGDSSFLNLKRAGICFANNRQPQKSVEYLLKAYEKDTADIETISYLAQDYMLLENFKKSVHYYNCEIKVLNPLLVQLGTCYIMMGEVLKSDNKYSEAISAYLKSQEYRSDNSVIMIVANLYDEKLNDIPKAIKYYDLYLSKEYLPKSDNERDYNESIRKRVSALKQSNQTAKKSYSVENTK